MASKDNAELSDEETNIVQEPSNLELKEIDIFMVAASAVRQHIQTDLKQKYTTINEGEDALGLSVEAYFDDSILSDKTMPSPAPLHDENTQEVDGNSVMYSAKDMLQKCFARTKCSKAQIFFRPQSTQPQSQLNIKALLLNPALSARVDEELERLGFALSESEDKENHPTRGARVQPEPSNISALKRAIPGTLLDRVLQPLLDPMHNAAITSADHLPSTQPSSNGISRPKQLVPGSKIIGDVPKTSTTTQE
ncbi:hypothetical protein ACROYT_G014235 [Oculina patagonica]